MTGGFIAESRTKSLWGYIHRAGELADAVQRLPVIVPHACPESMTQAIDDIETAIAALGNMRRCVHALKTAHELDNVEFPVRGAE